MKLTINDLYDLSHTLAGDYLRGFTYPWEALGGIGEAILTIGATLPENEYFCVNLKVKQRYINPLVGNKRLSEVSEKARNIIKDFKSYQDTPYGCVKLL